MSGSAPPKALAFTSKTLMTMSLNALYTNARSYSDAFDTFPNPSRSAAYFSVADAITSSWLKPARSSRGESTLKIRALTKA